MHNYKLLSCFSCDAILGDNVINQHINNKKHTGLSVSPFHISVIDVLDVKRAILLLEHLCAWYSCKNKGGDEAPGIFPFALVKLTCMICKNNAKIMYKN